MTAARSAAASWRPSMKSSIFRGLADSAAAAAIRARRIDILVNLNGYFGRARQGIFALRPCPIQVNYLGFPGDDRRRLHRLHHRRPDRDPAGASTRSTPRRSCACRRPTRSTTGNAASPTIRRAAPRRACPRPVSCSAASTTITRSRRRCSRSGCACCGRSPAASCGCSRTIRPRRAICGGRRSSRGMAPERLVFAPRVRLDEHLARHRLADLFLDTLPCNAHTTASDALMGRFADADHARQCLLGAGSGERPRVRSASPSSSPPTSRRTNPWRCSSQPHRRCWQRSGSASRETARCTRFSIPTVSGGTSKRPLPKCGHATRAASPRQPLPSRRWLNGDRPPCLAGRMAAS